MLFANNRGGGIVSVMVLGGALRVVVIGVTCIPVSLHV